MGIVKNFGCFASTFSGREREGGGLIQLESENEIRRNGPILVTN